MLFGFPDALEEGKGKDKGVGLVLEIAQSEHFNVSIMKYWVILILWEKNPIHLDSGLGKSNSLNSSFFLRTAVS